MRIPYGYQLENNGFIIFQEKAEVIRIIFDYYLSGANIGKKEELMGKFLSDMISLGIEGIFAYSDAKKKQKKQELF